MLTSQPQDVANPCWLALVFVYVVVLFGVNDLFYSCCGIHADSLVSPFGLHGEKTKTAIIGLCLERLLWHIVAGMDNHGTQLDVSSLAGDAKHTNTCSLILLSHTQAIRSNRKCHIVAQHDKQTSPNAAMLRGLATTVYSQFASTTFGNPEFSTMHVHAKRRSTRNCCSSPRLTNYSRL